MKRALVLAGVLVALIVLTLAGRKLLKAHSAPLSGDEPLEWREHQVGGVVLEAPGDFQGMNVDFGSADELIEKADAHKFASRPLEIQVIRILYKEGIELSLEGSVQGSIDGFAHQPGLQNLKHKKAACTVSGKPAMRVSITANRGRGVICLEGLTILDGRTLYQIQALYEMGDRHAAEYSQRIFGSIKVAP